MVWNLVICCSVSIGSYRAINSVFEHFCVVKEGSGAYQKPTSKVVVDAFLDVFYSEEDKLNLLGVISHQGDKLKTFGYECGTATEVVSSEILILI